MQAPRRPRHLLLALLLALGSLVALDATAGAAPPERHPYLVTLDAGRDPAAAARGDLDAAGARPPTRLYRHAVQGYVAELTEAQARAVSRRPGVVAVERDATVGVGATQTSPPSYGLDRIDQRNRPLDGSYTYTATGAPVDAYIIDTGIRATHQDLAGRVEPGVNTVDGTPSTQDCNGHGTHVAGTTGGTAHGVAKQVTLIAVRVFGCGNSTTTSAIVAGVDWAAGHHAAGTPAVANMSLGGGASTALDTAVRGLIADGVSVGIAAGNGNFLGMPVDSCSQSPARVAEAVTVSASDANDAKASFANYGTCVDLFAPGVGITSAWSTSDSATNTISGTSMAAPHVVGVMAQYLQLHPGATPAQVQAAVKDLSTKGIVSGTGGGFLGLSGPTPNNHLLFTNL